MKGKQERDKAIVELAKSGQTYQQIAKAYGLNAEYVGQLCRAAGVYMVGPRAKADVGAVKKMAADGMSEAEMAAALGISQSQVSRIICTNGIKRKRVCRMAEKRNEQMRAYKQSGHSMAETAIRFGVSKSVAQKACAGIAPQKAIGNQYTRGEFDQIGNFCRMLEDSNPSLEYVSGFTSVDKPVALLCKVCGCVFTRSAASVRHGMKLRCPGCYEREKAEREEANRVKAVADEAIREAKRIQRVVEDTKKKLEKEKARIAGIHNCPVCGKMTDRKKYCSAECANRRNNQLHDTRRRIRIQASIVDKDITLEKLYERDGGVCWICGLQCDWEDKTTREEVFIAGKYYPSIDHVVALADGGAHSWENVKLAHRICNSFRYYDDHGKGVC